MYTNAITIYLCVYPELVEGLEGLCLWRREGAFTLSIVEGDNAEELLLVGHVGEAHFTIVGKHFQLVTICNRFISFFY